jgi:hypothetical protein
MAQGQDCVACGSDHGVVLAHRNEHKARASGIDVWALELCFACHQWFDQGPAPREEKRRFFNDHYPQQVLRWIERGLLKVTK